MRLIRILTALVFAVGGIVATATPASAAPCDADGYCGPGNVLRLPTTLAHIQPWANADCNTWVYVGAATTVYFQEYNAPNWGPAVNSGTARWRYGTAGTCKGYQWIHFDLTQSAVNLMASRGYDMGMLLWLNGGGTTAAWSVSFTGGQADGDFLSWAIKAGPTATKAWIVHNQQFPTTDSGWFGPPGTGPQTAWCSTTC